MNCEETRTLIDAYVDGELDLVHNMEVEQHAASCERCGTELRNLNALQHSMRSAEMRFRVPQKLIAQIERDVRKESVPRGATKPFWAQFAYAAALLAVFAVSLAIWRGTSGQDRVADQIVASHVRSLMASHLFDVQSTDQHTVKPWFHGKLDYAPPVNDYAADGYPLIGGRMDFLDGHPVAAIVYQRRQHPINLFVWPTQAGDARPRNFAENGYNLIHWRKAGMDYWLVSDLGDNELRAFAQLLQK